MGGNNNNYSWKALHLPSLNESLKCSSIYYYNRMGQQISAKGENKSRLREVDCHYTLVYTFINLVNVIWNCLITCN